MHGGSRNGAPQFREKGARVQGRQVSAQGHPGMELPEPEDDCLLPRASCTRFPPGAACVLRAWWQALGALGIGLFYSDLSNPLQASTLWLCSLRWALRVVINVGADGVLVGRGVNTGCVRVGVSRDVEHVSVDGGQWSVGRKKLANGRTRLEVNTLCPK